MDRPQARWRRRDFTRGDPGWYAWVAPRLYRYGLERPTREVVEGFLGGPVSPAALLTDETRGHLALAHDALAAVPDWDHDALDAAVRKVAEANELKLGKLAQPLRAALTGKTTSPGIFDVLVLLGRDESLARIADQMPKAD